MKLKYFRHGTIDLGPEEGLILEERIFSIYKSDNNFIIEERCDNYFFEEFTKEQIIELFEEAIAWIKEN